MINQQQFQQAAKHYRSGRISLSEFQSRVFDSIDTDQQGTQDCVIQQGDPSTILGNILGPLRSAGQPVLVTGVCDALGEQLSLQIADGQFDSVAQTFACRGSHQENVSGDKIAVVAVAEVDANIKTGYLAAMIAADKQA